MICASAAFTTSEPIVVDAAPVAGTLLWDIPLAVNGPAEDFSLLPHRKAKLRKRVLSKSRHRPTRPRRCNFKALISGNG